jgi:hypothetical protein
MPYLSKGNHIQCSQVDINLLSPALGSRAATFRAYLNLIASIGLRGGKLSSRHV